ncbi:MAG TPA: cytochrome c [Caulobacteraceae bacterium]|nr:cytochrome c [Caulobacteraceae bacterium]
MARCKSFALVGAAIALAFAAPTRAQNDPLARGRYLVDTQGHCAGCHSPRGATAGAAGAYLAGGVAQGWIAPNLTSDRVSGLGGWSDAEIARYLKTGQAEGKARADGPMAKVVQFSLSKLSDADIAAMVAYLRTAPAIRTPGQTAPAWGVDQAKPIAWTDFEQPEAPNSSPARLDFSTNDGALLYNVSCAACHGMHGEGAADGSAPSLIHNAAVGAPQPTNLVKVMLEGVDRMGPGAEHTTMPAFSAQTHGIASPLSSRQIAAVANYVTEKFGYGDAHLTEADVSRIAASAKAPPAGH